MNSIFTPLRGFFSVNYSIFNLLVRELAFLLLLMPIFLSTANHKIDDSDLPSEENMK